MSMCHRFTSVVIVLLSCGVSFAELSMGVDVQNLRSVSSTLTIMNDSEQENISRNNSFILSPRIGISSSELLEISPFLNFGISKTAQIQKTDDDETESSLTQVSIGGGCGVYFHLVRKELIHLSIGPKLQFNFAFEPVEVEADSTVESPYDFYANYSFGAALPVNLDVRLADHFGLRLSADLVSLTYHILKTEQEQLLTNQTIERTQKNIIFNIRSLFEPIFGFIIYF